MSLCQGGRGLGTPAERGDIPSWAVVPLRHSHPYLGATHSLRCRRPAAPPLRRVLPFPLSFPPVTRSPGSAIPNPHPSRRDGAATLEGGTRAAPRHARSRPLPALRRGDAGCHDLCRAPAPRHLPQR